MLFTFATEDPFEANNMQYADELYECIESFLAYAHNNKLDQMYDFMSTILRSKGLVVDEKEHKICFENDIGC